MSESFNNPSTARPHRDTDNETIIRLKTGDESAFVHVVNTYFARIAGFAYTIVHSYDAAQDVAQDVFVRLWESRHILDPARSIKPYLFALTRNHALNYLKFQEVRARYQAKILDDLRYEPGATATPSKEGEILSATMVHAALSQLSDRRRIAVRLRLEEQMTHSEIAQVLEMNPAAAERLVQRGLEELRAILRERGVSGLREG